MSQLDSSLINPYTLLIVSVRRFQMLIFIANFLKGLLLLFLHLYFVKLDVNGCSAFPTMLQAVPA